MQFCKVIKFCSLLLGAFLLSINILGLSQGHSYRDKFKVEKDILSYEQVISQIDASFYKFDESELFLKKSVEIYNSGIIYKWPIQYTQISVTDNYILWGFGFFNDKFKVFESSTYKRALGRGFGICSQNAIGLADLLHKRYDIETHIIGLGGHVVLEATVEDKQYILDPSANVFIPFSLAELESNISIAKKYYFTTNYTSFAKLFNVNDNKTSPLLGGGAASYVS